MKIQLALLFAFFSLLWSMPVGAAPVVPANTADLPVCDLPAPTNVQRFFPNPATVTYTWDPVAGAVKYFAVLTNLTLGGVVVSQDPVGTTVSFPIIAGHQYQFKVAAMCAEKLVSINYTYDNFTAPFVVIDLIVEVNSGCSDYGSSIGTYFDQNGTRTWTYSFGYDRGYWMKIPLPQGGGNVMAYFKRSELSAFTYDMTVLDPSGSLYSMFCPGGGSTCQRARLSTASGPLVDIFFENESKISAYKLDNSGVAPEFTVHNECSHGGGRSPGDASQAGGAEPTILPLNPFRDALDLFFSETPAQTTSLRLLDLQGRVCLQTEIQPEQISENIYSLSAPSLLPGLYFLHLKSASGQIQVRKVIKQ
ncbi:MAG: T9SS type A sorting domain-containing protein [Saprospiraceae bacterium]|nr:T9SS type A sorting domain-containing protein [Saprospiraceae bacterium]